jgi:hypothetical protein
MADVPGASASQPQGEQYDPVALLKMVMMLMLMILIWMIFEALIHCYCCLCIATAGSCSAFK